MYIFGTEKSVQETNTQASFRLLWLWNLDKIKRNEDGKYVKR